MSNQQQPLWKQVVPFLFLIAPAGISSFFGLLCVSFPLWGHSLIFAPGHYPIDQTVAEPIPSCTFAVSNTIPIIVWLICSEIVALSVPGILYGSSTYFFIAAAVSFCLLLFFFSMPMWGWAFVFGDNAPTGTGCEMVFNGAFLVGSFVGIVLIIFNLIAAALLNTRSKTHSSFESKSPHV
jgi:hypothetical protein